MCSDGVPILAIKVDREGFFAEQNDGILLTGGHRSEDCEGFIKILHLNGNSFEAADAHLRSDTGGSFTLQADEASYDLLFEFDEDTAVKMKGGFTLSVRPKVQQ